MLVVSHAVARRNTGLAGIWRSADAGGFQWRIANRVWLGSEGPRLVARRFSQFIQGVDDDALLQSALGSATLDHAALRLSVGRKGCCWTEDRFCKVESR